MTDAVKAIPTNALFKPLVGASIDGGLKGQGGVKRGIEDSTLGHRWQRLFNSLDILQRRWVVSRSENSEPLDSGFDCWRDERARSIVLTSVDNPMSHDIDL